MLEGDGLIRFPQNLRVEEAVQRRQQRRKAPLRIHTCRRAELHMEDGLGRELEGLVLLDGLQETPGSRIDDVLLPSSNLRRGVRGDRIVVNGFPSENVVLDIDALRVPPNEVDVLGEHQLSVLHVFFPDGDLAATRRALKSKG